MSNARIQQLVTLFYMHRTMVESDGIKKSESEEIQKVMKELIGIMTIIVQIL